MSSKVVSCIYDLLDLSEAGMWRDDGTIVLKRPPASSKLEKVKFRSFSANILPSISNSSVPTIYAELKAHLYGLNDDASDYSVDALPEQITINTLQGTTTYSVDEGSILLASFTTTIEGSLESSVENALKTAKATLCNLLAFKEDDYYLYAKPVTYRVLASNFLISLAPCDWFMPYGMITHETPDQDDLMYFANPSSVAMQPVSLQGYALSGNSYSPQTYSGSLTPLHYARCTKCIPTSDNIMSVTWSQFSDTEGWNVCSRTSTITFTCAQYNTTTKQITTFESRATTAGPFGAAYHVVYDAQAFEPNSIPNRTLNDTAYVTYLYGGIEENITDLSLYSYPVFKAALQHSNKLDPAFRAIPLLGAVSEGDKMDFQPFLDVLFKRLDGVAGEGHYFAGFHMQWVDGVGHFCTFKFHTEKTLCVSVIWFKEAVNGGSPEPVISTPGFDFIIDNVRYKPSESDQSLHRHIMMYGNANNSHLYFTADTKVMNEFFFEPLDNSLQLFTKDHRAALNPWTIVDYSYDAAKGDLSIVLPDDSTNADFKVTLAGDDSPLPFITTRALDGIDSVIANLCPAFYLQTTNLIPPGLKTDVYRSYSKNLKIESSVVTASSVSGYVPVGDKHASFGTQPTLLVNASKLEKAFVFDTSDGTYKTLLLKTSDGKYVIEFYCSIYTDPDVFDFSVDYANSSLYDEGNSVPFVNSLAWSDNCANASYGIDSSINNLDPQVLANLNTYIALRNTDLTLKLVSNEYPTINNIVFYLNETAMIDFKEAACSPNEAVLECRIIDSKGNLLVPSDAALLYANIVVAVDWQFY